MRCYINKENCKKADTEACNSDCKAFILLEAIYSTSNIPRRYQVDKPLSPDKVDLDNFLKLKKYQSSIIERVENGDNILIYSKTTGNGKTSWATKLANEYIRKKVFSKDIEDLVYFVNTTELLEELRRGYNDGEYDGIIGKLKRARIVIFDDLGAEKSTEWVRERLYSIINYRICEGLMNIYTTNLDIEHLSINLGNRIGSRLKENTMVIELKGTDRRGV